MDDDLIHCGKLSIHADSILFDMHLNICVMYSDIYKELFCYSKLNC